MTDLETTPTAVDLTNCDREPIHIIGNIQPYGALVAAAPDTLRIVQASDSVEPLLGIAPGALIGASLADLLMDTQREAVHTAVSSGALAASPRTLFTGCLASGAGPFHATLHVADGLLLTEIEPVLPDEVGDPDAYALLRETLARFQNATRLDAFCRVVAAEVRRIIGFDRVMVYRFDEDGAGTVIAEDLAEGQESYLGLRYPASDIPKQARALYLLNALRLIPDAKYQPSALVPPVPPETGKPTDLSRSFLRGVSQMHVEYLANMGVAASMSLAIVTGGKLWGLVACHHREPRRLSPTRRAACEFLSSVVSMQIAEKETSEGQKSDERGERVYRSLVSSMARGTGLINGLCGDKPSVKDYIDCCGCAVLAEGEMQCIGATPAPEQIERLVDWIQAGQGELDVYATDALPSQFPAANRYKETAAGVLALRISGTARAYVLWFRPEAVRTVDWAGNPNKGGSPERLHPRKSFELWRETVYGKSTAWDPREIEAAGRLRTAVADVLLRRVEELSRLNVDLKRSNVELDSFAYIASHDLKEPLRGINNYVHFLREDYADKLDDEGRDRIETLLRLTRRMESLIESLLRYSRVGRQQLNMRDCDLNKIVAEVAEPMTARIAEQDVEIRVPRPLPVVRCDPDQIAEVFSNLISNAIKYNLSSPKLVEIGYSLDAAPPGSSRKAARPRIALYVHDNGIGIREKHYETIFRIFKRLHGRDEYGGGSGAGLTIAAKIVERHGGALWLESAHGQGTTFYFTLEG